MKDFKEYLKSKENKSPEDFLESRKGKNEDELLQELLATAAKSKQDGSLNDESLKAFQKTVEPMLNDEQKAKLKDIMERIKKV